MSVDHRGDPFWVPPLRAEVRARIDTRKNPFLEYGQVRLFAVKGESGRIIARAAAVFNPRHNRKHGDRTGFFGLFEALDDQEAARRLFAAVGDALRASGCDRMVGPVNFTTNDETGVLVDGFDARPAFMTSYSPRYYDALLTASGLEKEIDLLSYGWSVDHPYPERFLAHVGSLKTRVEIRIRPIVRKSLREELARVQAVYNAAFDDVWGFVPMTPAETDDMGKGFKMIADDDLILLAECDGQVVGFCLALPDINEILKDLDGRLLPFGFVRLLLRKKLLRSARIMVLCALPAFRDKGLGEASRSKGILPDFNSMINDRAVKAIFALRGGYGTPRILDALDYRGLKRSPKIIVGYSDLTSLQLAVLRKCSLVTFSGPMVAVEMWNGIDPYTEEHFWRLLTSSKAPGPLTFPPEHTPRAVRRGKARGMLIGGNLALLMANFGTPYIPSLAGTILFVEDVDEAPHRVDRMFRQLKNAGTLSSIADTRPDRKATKSESGRKEQKPIQWRYTR